MRATKVDVARDFSETPSGRYPEDGEFSGEVFRKKHLVPSLRDFDQVEVILDGTEGFGSSFLEEAFGGLIREEGFSLQQVVQKLTLVATDASSRRYKEKIEEYLRKAQARKSASS